MDALPGFVMAGIALAGSPGPNTLSLAAAGAAFGARRVMAYFIGLLLGMVVVMAVVAAGLVGMVLAVPGATPVVTVAAALYFIYLAWRIATAPPLGEGTGQGKPPSFVAGVMLSLVNPKGYAAMAALFSGFVLVHERIAVDAMTKIVVLVVVIAAVNILWLQMGALLTRYFRDPRTSRIINVAFAILLLASVALAVMAA
ncbi:MAG TPA: LysE family transporter [Reyranella sp.]|nr:LysE family transporter [Reyranella sp.]